MRRVLVTGAGGFLGRAIVALLHQRDLAIRSISRGHYPDLEAMGVECVQGDIRDAGQVSQVCEDIDTVFHVAAFADIWGPWEKFYTINTQGTLNLLAACEERGVERLVFTSSPSVTFAGEPQCNVDESASYPTQWLCHYPHTKSLAERAVLAANGRHALRTCALRPHLIWGPGDSHLIPRLLERARLGQLRRIGDGANLIDITYIDNAAEAHLQAADHLIPNSPVPGKAYFVSQGEPVNCWAWIDEILELAGLPPVHRAISYRAAWILGGVLEAIARATRQRSEPRMTRFLAAQMATSHYFDISAARRDFGYTPRISTEEGMRRLAAVMRREERLASGPKNG